jgi:branched-chain amino acid transport system ATP-binding protein
MLNIKDLKVLYGAAEVIKGISMDIKRGEIVSLIGANGAGKTTVLRTISGLKRPTSGEIWFCDQRIDGLPAYEIVNLGVSHCPEGRRLFHSMKVINNLFLGAYLCKDKNKMARDLENVYDHFPVLKARSKQLAGSLSGGEQQMVAMGRALMAGPKLLLMDEPSLGLSPIMVAEVGKIVKNVKETGVSIILVEQNARMALKVSNRTYVLEIGEIKLSGPSSEVAKDERVRKAYLGIN